MLGYKDDPREDYCYSIFSPTASFGSRPSFVHVHDLPSQGYGGVYLHTAETAKAVEQATTTAQYAGVVWSERLWIDVDSYEQAEEVKNKIVKMDVNYVMYNSGYKGVHFGLWRPIVPSHLLPALDKVWVRSNFPEADLSIYTHMHLFRLIGSVHEKTGRKKMLMGSGGNYYLDVGSYSDHVKKIKVLRIPVNKETSVFESIRVMGNTLPTRVGERHPTMVRAVYALKDKQVDPSVARWWVGEINKMCEEPKEEKELDQIVASVYERL